MITSSVTKATSFLYRNVHSTVAGVYSSVASIYSSVGDVMAEIDRHSGVGLKEGKGDSRLGKKPFTVLVEGNIGSGKTTFLQHFSKFPNVDVLAEPVAKWRDLKGHNLLQKMYEDQNRWSLTFQTYVQLTMLEQHVKHSDLEVKMMERSIFSAKYCFVENLHNSGKMPSSEYEVLSAWFRFLVENPSIDLGVDLIVYLKTSPEKALERVKSRNRGEEHLIPIEYLNDLHTLHENWLIRGNFPIPAPVVVINADKDLGEMQEEYVKQESTIFGEDKENILSEREDAADMVKGHRERSRSPLKTRKLSGTV